jgi:hypothetical protein
MPLPYHALQRQTSASKNQNHCAFLATHHNFMPQAYSYPSAAAIPSCLTPIRVVPSSRFVCGIFVPSRAKESTYGFPARGQGLHTPASGASIQHAVLGVDAWRRCHFLARLAGRWLLCFVRNSPHALQSDSPVALSLRQKQVSVTPQSAQVLGPLSCCFRVSEAFVLDASGSTRLPPSVSALGCISGWYDMSALCREHNSAAASRPA